MELPPANEASREKLLSVRNTVLSLHKALLDSERTAYELVHGSVGPPGAFLQLLIKDPWFAWLQPVTNIIVLIDEALAAKRPPATDADLARLLEDTRALFSPSKDGEANFWKRYQSSIQRDPAVDVLHRQLAAALAAV